MIAPRKLQSFAAAVQAVAAAVSSVRSTSNVVVSNGMRVTVAGTARTDIDFSLVEFEDAVCVYLRDTPTKTTSTNTERGSVLFMMYSNLDLVFRQYSTSLELGAGSIGAH
jgi:hypothetical protein